MADKPKKLTAQLTPTDDKKRPEVKVKVPKTENIIFIGSEMHYDLFWLKMMFISAAYKGVEKLRKADKNTIAYVPEGYIHAEKLAIDYLSDAEKYKAKKFEIKKITSSAELIKCMNQDRDKYKLQDVMFFSHGVIDAISLNYEGGDDDVDLTVTNFLEINKKAFAANGRIYSYACRTGVSVEDLKRGFKTEIDAKPELSLAQKMATYFDIEVHAFLRRSDYAAIIRNKADSETIVSTLKESRKTKDGQLIDIPPSHEALPHEGLANRHGKYGVGLFGGPLSEGTDNYALWRKEGGMSLPVAADSPAGLPTEMRVFKPKKK
jgi:hypothetical protein